MTTRPRLHGVPEHEAMYAIPSPFDATLQYWESLTRQWVDLGQVTHLQQHRDRVIVEVTEIGRQFLDRGLKEGVSTLLAAWLDEAKRFTAVSPDVLNCGAVPLRWRPPATVDEWLRYTGVK